MTNCTNKNNCIRCVLAGYCLNLKSKAVTMEELKNPYFLYDFLKFGHSLGLEDAEWKPFLNESLLKYSGDIVDESGKAVFVDTEVFEIGEDTLFTGSKEDVSRAFERIRDFFSYWFGQERELREKVHFRGNTGEKLLVVASILRAQNPHEASFWGLEGKAANDNTPQAANDN